MTFYNTSNETNPQLNEFRKVAEKQDAKVLNVLQKHGELTAWQVVNKIAAESMAYEKGMLLTSVRRSLNTLYKHGVIMKSKQVVNHFKRKEWKWQVL
jgi:Fe2+ or Zn2+ uptake regulation protein